MPLSLAQDARRRLGARGDRARAALGLSVARAGAPGMGTQHSAARQIALFGDVPQRQAVREEQRTMKRTPRRPLLVIDGDNFAHRSYHALPKTIRRKGNRGAG